PADLLKTLLFKPTHVPSFTPTPTTKTKRDKIMGMGRGVYSRKRIALCENVKTIALASLLGECRDGAICRVCAGPAYVLQATWLIIILAYAVPNQICHGASRGSVCYCYRSVEHRTT
ncbi:unnamed protein product, partial [Ectocarpus sp. 13 AM-2016]